MTKPKKLRPFEAWTIVSKRGFEPDVYGEILLFDGSLCDWEREPLRPGNRWARVKVVEVAPRRKAKRGKR